MVVSRVGSMEGEEMKGREGGREEALSGNWKELKDCCNPTELPRGAGSGYARFTVLYSVQQYG